MAIALVLLVGGAMRLVDLGEKSLWVDEIRSLYIARNVPRLLGFCRTGHEPPGRYLAVWALKQLPHVDFSVRIPAALFGTLSLALVLWIGRMLWDRRTGLVAAVLLMLSPWHLHHSQDARYYAVMLFLSLAALGLDEASIIDTAEAMGVTFPGYVDLMNRLGANIELR